MAKVGLYVAGNGGAYSSSGKYIPVGKGGLMYHTRTERGQYYGEAYRISKKKFWSCYFIPKESRPLALYNRKYSSGKWSYGGSKYTIRKKTTLKRSGKKNITLYAGDKVAMRSNQGWASAMHGGWIRCDGYYRKGKSKYNSTNNGYVYNDPKNSPSKTRINTK